MKNKRRSLMRKTVREDDDDDDDDCTETEECGMEVWNTLSKSFRQVQSVLDHNRSLIQQVNENHQSRIFDNLAKTSRQSVRLMVISLVSSRFTPICLPISPMQSNRGVQLRSQKPAKTMEVEVLTWQGTQTTETKATYLESEPASLLPSSLIICPQA